MQLANLYGECQDQQRRMSRCEIKDVSKKERRIAIIGAGFAGLTLANYLSKHSNVRYQLFEAKSEPIPIIGTIRLSHGRQVLKELGMTLEPSSSTAIKSDHMDRFSREWFLNKLRSGVSINYSCPVIGVRRTVDGGFYYLKTEQGHEVGPFDVVVVADGLSGKDLGMDNDDNSCDAVYVVGDARWYEDVWFWDFGRKRINFGADIAICDAIEFGRILLDKTEISSNNCKFLVPTTRRNFFLIRRRILIPIFLAAILYRIKFEKV